MSKRNIILVSGIVLAVLLVVGGTMAWFTAEPKEAVNSFKAGTVKIELHDVIERQDEETEIPFSEITNVNPGDEYPKVVYVENTGSESAFIRVQLTPVWEDSLPNENDSVKIADYPILNGWVLHTDDSGEWYYYTQVVEAGDTTTNVIDKVIFAGKEMNNDYQGKQFTLKVKAEAIQASNGAALDEWGVNPLTLE